MTDRKKPWLSNLLLVLIVVLAAVVIAQFVRRSMNVRRELAETQPSPAAGATTTRVYPTVTIPVDTVRELLKAVATGDHDAAMNRLVCNDEDAQREAEAIIGEKCVRIRFSQVARRAFGKQVPPVAPGSAAARLTSDLENTIKNAWVRVDGGRAQVTVRGKLLFCLVRVDGDWKVDYDQTRKLAPTGLSGEQVDQAISREQILQQITTDIVAGKFKSYSEVMAKLLEMDRSFPMQLPPVYPIAATPMDALSDYITAVATGDADAMFNRLYFSSDDSRREAVAVIGLPFATQRFLMAAGEAYGKDAPPVDLRPNQTLADQMRRGMRGATLKVEGALAELTEPSGDAIYMQNVDGDWKIDYELLQRLRSGVSFSDTDTAARCARYQVLMDMVTDVRARAFPTFAAANDELSRRVVEALGGPATAARIVAIMQIEQLSADVYAFQEDNGRFPTQVEGLGALVSAPTDLVAAETWTKSLEAVPQDPWGHELKYVFPLPDGTKDFDIMSAGPDGQFGTDDDLRKSTQE